MSRNAVMGLFTMLSIAGSATAAELACGDVIVSSTKLDHDLLDCPGDGLVVGASGITIDLDGHVVDGDGAGTGIRVDGHAGVKVVGGTIRDFRIGVGLTDADNCLVKDLFVSRYDGGYGVFLHGSHGSRVVRNQLSGGADTISAIYLEASDGNVIARNLGRNDDNAIIRLVDSDGNGVLRNTARGSNTSGISLSGSTGNVVWRNDASNNEAEGIRLVSGSADNTVADNVVPGSRARGISVLGSQGNALIRNVVTDSDLDGIFVAADSAGTLVRANTAALNGGDGIDVRNPATTITRNVADDNAELGIRAVPGVEDGGGNEASGNGDPAQCMGVICR